MSSTGNPQDNWSAERLWLVAVTLTMLVCAASQLAGFEAVTLPRTLQDGPSIFRSAMADRSIGARHREHAAMDCQMLVAPVSHYDDD